MFARIYKTYPIPTQFYQDTCDQWIVEFLSIHHRFQEQYMGWIGSVNMRSSQVRLRFQSRSQAIQFVKNNNISYIENKPMKRQHTIKSYIDNYL